MPSFSRPLLELVILFSIAMLSKKDPLSVALNGVTDRSESDTPSEIDGDHYSASSSMHDSTLVFVAKISTTIQIA